MKKIIFIILALLLFSKAEAGKEYAVEFPSGTPLEVYTPNNPPSSQVSDETYGPSWDNITTVAPSKNSVYDKIETLSGGTPGGSNTYIQYNDAGAFGGESSFTYDKTINTLTADIYDSTLSSGTVGYLRLKEDPANGTNYVGFQAPSSVLASLLWTLPSADGTNGQSLITNGNKTLSFSTITGGGGGTPGGSDTQVQFNDGGSFAGDSGLTYNKTTDSLTVGKLYLGGDNNTYFTLNGSVLELYVNGVLKQSWEETETYYALLETGDHMLLEIGDDLLLED